MANYQDEKPGKKGYTRFLKYAGSVVRKTSGWKISRSQKVHRFIDGFQTEFFRKVGYHKLQFYAPEETKKVQEMSHADGY